MKLYYAPGSCSLSTHIALREAGLPFELVRVQGRGVPKTAGNEAYLDVTPKNYVPALRLDNGEVLTECTAILPFIADQAPGRNLAPAAGSMARYRLHEWLGYISSELHKGFAPFFTPGTSDEAKVAAQEKMGAKFEFVAAQLTSRPWLLGKDFTVADAYLSTVLGWCQLVAIDLAKWPVLQDYLDRARARPAVMEARKAEGLVK